MTDAAKSARRFAQHGRRDLECGDVSPLSSGATRRGRPMRGLVSTLPDRPCAAGFSLVEVMVAILILGVALVGLTQGVTTALSSGRESEQQAAAALFAAGQIEQLRVDLGLKDEETEGDCEGLPRYRWRQTISPAGIDGLHEVVVVVLHAKSGQRIYELRTLLFEQPVDSDSNRNQTTSQRTGGGR